MILVDANLLIYASNSAADEHARTAAWLNEVLSGTEPVGLSWSVIHAYLRLITNRRVVADPFTIEEAISVVDEWISQPGVSIVNPGHGYWSFLREILSASRVKGDVVNDAHIAALALEQDATV